MDRADGELSRRDVLRVAAGTGVAGATVGTGNATAAEGGGGGSTTVDMTDDLVFSPDEITVAPGDTVVWENTGTIGHSVTAYEEDIPSGATYFASGGFEGEDAARQAYPEGDVPGGETFEHTFETEGTYEYFCIPHESAGMVGTVEVVTGGASPDAGPTSLLSDSAKTIGIAVTGAMMSVLGLAYFFMKYGGDYGETED